MSRLRRLALADRIFFVTTHFQESALPISNLEKTAILEVLHATRARRKFQLFAYVVMPTHVHLLFSPTDKDTLIAIMREFKMRASKAILKTRGASGGFWQARSFDRIVRTPKEFAKTLLYIHFNAVKDGLVDEPSKWKWSSWAAYQLDRNEAAIPVVFANLPTDENSRLW